MPPLLRSSRSAGPPEHPPPPGLDVQHHQLPSHLIPSKAKPLAFASDAQCQYRPGSEAHEAEDRCFRVSVARRLLLPHPAAPDPSGVVLACPHNSAAGQICGKPVDTQQHRCCGCRRWRRSQAAVARCLADVIHTAAPKENFEQAIPAFSREWPGRRCTRGCCLQSKRCHDVDRCRRCHSLLQQPSPPRPDHMAKRAEKIKVDRYPHVNLVPFILETTGRPGYHAKKFISNFMKDADNPSVVIRDT